jgi:hypothetical protein
MAHLRKQRLGDVGKSGEIKAPHPSNQTSLDCPQKYVMCCAVTFYNSDDLRFEFLLPLSSLHATIQRQPTLLRSVSTSTKQQPITAGLRKKQNLNSRKELMKRQTNWISTQWMAIVVTLSGGLSLVSSAPGQSVTGDAYLDNVTPTALYAAWSTALSVSSGPTGLEILSQTAYGSFYYAVPAGQQQILNPADDQATLVMTFNNPSSPPGQIGGNYWFGIPFILDDPATGGSGGTTFGGYTGEYTSYNPTASPGTASWNGNTVTETVPLSGALLSDIQAGGDAITGFNLEFAPASDPDGFTDITFNSLTLSSSVPEPSTLTLLGTGAAALWSSCRRRKK